MLPNAEMGLHCLNNTVIEEGIFEIRNDKFLIRRHPFVILHLLTTFLFSPLSVQKLFIFNEHWIIHI